MSTTCISLEEITSTISKRIEACSSVENTCKNAGLYRIAEFTSGRIEGMREIQNIICNFIKSK